MAIQFCTEGASSLLKPLSFSAMLVDETTLPVSNSDDSSTYTESIFSGYGRVNLSSANPYIETNGISWTLDPAIFIHSSGGVNDTTGAGCLLLPAPPTPGTNDVCAFLPLAAPVTMNSEGQAVWILPKIQVFGA